MGQLCDDGCKVLLDKNYLWAFKNSKIILKGYRSTNGDGLWDIPITLSTQAEAKTFLNTDPLLL